MKGIVLAGGTGSRLHPLTKVTNKHLLPVGRKPMIYYPIEKLVELPWVDEILIVTGTEHMGAVVGLLGSGKDFGCRFTYKVQDEAGGIAQALALAENFVKGDHSITILGDNIFEDSLIAAIDYREGVQLFLKEVLDPSKFGVAELKNGKIAKIVEKPEIPLSPYAVTGIYVYDCTVFDCIRTLKPSNRGELEITDVNNYYIEKGKCSHKYLEGYWTDAGTFETLSAASQLVEL